MIRISSFEIKNNNKKAVRRKGKVAEPGFNNAMNKYNQNLPQDSYNDNSQYQREQNNQYLYNSTSLFNHDFYNYDKSLGNVEEKRLKSVDNSKFDKLI